MDCKAIPIRVIMKQSMPEGNSEKNYYDTEGIRKVILHGENRTEHEEKQRNSKIPHMVSANRSDYPVSDYLAFLYA